MPSFLITAIHFPVRVMVREDLAKVKGTLWLGGSRISSGLG